MRGSCDIFKKLTGKDSWNSTSDCPGCPAYASNRKSCYWSAAFLAKSRGPHNIKGSVALERITVCPLIKNREKLDALL